MSIPQLPKADLITRPSTPVLMALLLALAVSWFGTLDYRKLIKSDEGRYAEIAREMAVTGDWVTPRYNGVKYFEKPPLQYWATAAAFRVFGENEWTARLWTALTGFAGIALLFLTGQALFGRMAGLLSAAVLASSILWVGAGHVSSLDMGVTFFLQCVLCTLLLAHRPGITPGASRGLMLACWAAMALAVLSKGLIGIVLPGLVLVVYLAVTRDAGLLLRLHAGKGLGVFFAIAAPWFVMVSIRNPEFAHFFFIHEHFGRYLVVEGYNRYGPWWYFPVLLAAGMLPWTLAMPHALASGPGAGGACSPAGGVRARLMLVLWTLVILVFFSLSRSKLPGYIIPVLPAIALLIGTTLATMRRAALQLFLAGALIVAILALFASMYVSAFAPTQFNRGAYASFDVWVRIGIGVILAGTFVSLLWLRLAVTENAGRLGALLTFAVFSHLGWQTVLVGHESLRARMSAYDLAMEVNKIIDRTQPFYAVRIFDHTLPFYMKKTMTLVENQDELAFGLSVEPGLWVASITEFEKRWALDRKPMALMPNATFAQLQKSGLPMRIVARDEGSIVVEKPSP